MYILQQLSTFSAIKGIPPPAPYFAEVIVYSSLCNVPGSCSGNFIIRGRSNDAKFKPFIYYFIYILEIYYVARLNSGFKYARTRTLCA